MLAIRGYGGHRVAIILDLRKNPMARIVLERLAGLSGTERRYNLTREEDPEDSLFGGRYERNRK